MVRKGWLEGPIGSRGHSSFSNIRHPRIFLQGPLYPIAKLNYVKIIGLFASQIFTKMFLRYAKIKAIPV